MLRDKIDLMEDSRMQNIILKISSMALRWIPDVISCVAKYVNYA